VAEARTSVDARLWIGLFVFVTLSYTLLLLPRDTFDSLIHEDGVVEWVGAIGLFCASFISFMGFRQARAAGANRLLTWSLFFLALLFFFGAGEEISWGQRIFGWGTPDALDNGQHETNLHNLGPVQNGSPLLRTNALFAYFWFMFAFVLPAGVLVSERVRRLLDGKLPLFPILMGLLFIWNEVFSEVVERALPDSLYHGTAHISTTITEIRESCFETLFAVSAFLMVAELARRGILSMPRMRARGPETVPASREMQS